MSVSEISRESVLQRALRENALAGMMLVLTIIGLVNGLIIGIAAASMMNQSEKYDALRTQYEITSIYVNNLHAYLESKGLEPPQPPQVQEEE